jgi:signal transduction histidine kinase
MARALIPPDWQNLKGSALQAEGVGIAGMRERAMLAGGNLEVMSDKGAGCHVLFRVPISQEPNP